MFFFCCLFCGFFFAFCFEILLHCMRKWIFFIIMLLLFESVSEPMPHAWFFTPVFYWKHRVATFISFCFYRTSPWSQIFSAIFLVIFGSIKWCEWIISWTLRNYDNLMYSIFQNRYDVPVSFEFLIVAKMNNPLFIFATIKDPKIIKNNFKRTFDFTASYGRSIGI